MSNKIVVVGSINVDRTLHIQQIPKPGETVRVRDITQAPGGKGANQAVSAKRSGSEVTFIGAIGKDENGKFMLATLSKEGINIDHITSFADEKTGNATIMLSDAGQNSILMYPGANNKISHSQINSAAAVLKSSNFIVANFETTQEAIIDSFKLAKGKNVKTILNPAPASKINEKLYGITDVIAPNETESEVITGIHISDKDSLEKTGKYFRNKGIPVTLITLGSKGVFLSTPNITKLIPAYKVKAKDTTAAGDTFIGALAAELKTDFSNIEDAIKYAQQASSITVQRYGAIPSIPTRQEIKNNY